MEKNNTSDSPSSEKLGQSVVDVQKNDQKDQSEEVKSINISEDDSEMAKDNDKFYSGENVDNDYGLLLKSEGDVSHDSVNNNISRMDEGGDVSKIEGDNMNNFILQQVGLSDEVDEVKSLDRKPEGGKQTPGELSGDVEKKNPIFGGTEVPVVEASRTTSSHSADADQETDGSARPEKAMTFRDYVKNKGVVAVTGFLHVLSGKKDGIEPFPSDEDKGSSDFANDRETADVSQKPGDKSAWNPLSYIMASRNADVEDRAEQGVERVEEPPEPMVMKGRIILYTRLGCQNCKDVRLFLYHKRLRYVEINIDVYPSRKQELEKFTGSSAVPKVFFNEVVIGGLSELKGLDESGKLQEKIDYLITEAPGHEAPLPPLSGEDDVSTSGSFDELALIVRKMKETIVVKDRFYKMRRFTGCFLGSEAIEFLSEDQYLEREDAIEFGRKLASKLFFRHVLDENLFEDGNHLYWFLDDDPIVSSQCHNIPVGIIEAKPKPITEIASRLRFVFFAINEAYTSEDGKHIDYRSIHGSEEFARYLRIIQELQRVEFHDLPREEKLAFFINLHNLMVIHAILVLGYPNGALERRKFFGDFKYVIGGCTFSLSAIQNGILRANQRPPYNLMKPFGVNDKRCKAALPYPEPLIHFALVNGTRSGPALKCYSPGNVDKELLEAARCFLRGGGLVIDVNAKVAHVSKILKWFSMDFGKNEVEVLKHASNYLEPTNSELLLELLANGQLKVQYQTYDWGLNL
ncbi:uncharacterized protein LOC126672499 [Mercurialis annua]|uniref:uncharacterized protein LOC126672499 n=1 Tax=Mercurialis annua TaxID=3986 RepID=UPI00215EB6FD|nr:uncharacterized protein LOC126672499 [Mercurialis annua]XP_050223131.1 uncharacterized protein LOC126672499 [Mercurialis annua]